MCRTFRILLVVWIFGSFCCSSCEIPRSRSFKVMESGRNWLEGTVNAALNPSSSASFGKVVVDSFAACMIGEEQWGSGDTRMYDAATFRIFLFELTRILQMCDLNPGICVDYIRCVLTLMKGHLDRPESRYKVGYSLCLLDALDGVRKRFPDFGRLDPRDSLLAAWREIKSRYGAQ